jgi:carbamate kinase
MSETVLVALGGNALVRPDDAGTFDQQVANAREIADYVAGAVESDMRVVLSHGNGPQVGNILMQNEGADADAQEMPLFACGAQSQGLVGAALSLALDSAFRRQNSDRCAVPILTPVVVDGDDVEEATKPVGPFYSEADALARQETDGTVFREDSGRGWRRVVPSPEPEEIRCTTQVEQILASENVPIAAGGGGLPITLDDDGYRYVNGVVDKDLAAGQLASELGVDRFVILTDVSHVWLDFDTPRAKKLEQVSRSTAREYQAAGHFGRGSMYEKVEAVCRFLEATAETEAVIASLDESHAAIEGDAGTRFEQDDSVREPKQDW